MYRILSGDFSNQYAQFKDTVAAISISNSNIAILLLLSIVNWLLEAYKWQKLVAAREGDGMHIRFRESIKHVLTAHIAGLITPAKLGAYGIKPLFFKETQHKRIAFLHFLGSWSQMFITTVIGVLGSLYLGKLFFTSYTFLIAVAIALISLIFIVVHRSKKWSYLEKIVSFLKGFPKKQGVHIIGIAFLRYVAFAHQFYFLLTIFQVPLAYPIAMSLIGVYYWGSSLLPLNQLLDVFVKGSVAVLVFSSYGVPQLIIVTVAFIMWSLNVLLPILPASYFLMRLRIKAFPKFMTSSSW